MSVARAERRDGAAGTPPGLSRAACIVLVRTLLEPPDDPRTAGPAALFRRHGGDDAAVTAWLDALERDADGPAAARTAVLERLAAGFTVAGEPPDTVPEGAALRAAVAAAAAARSDREEFAAAVAAARLEALREFAYGAGHEINNPLANIAARAQSLLLDEQSPERRRRLAVIVDQAFRGRDMIGGLMVFARPPKPAPRAVGVGAVLAAVIEAVKPLAATRGARLEYDPPPVPVEVFADPGQVTEAVRLVVSNALEAEGAGGRVTLEARRREDPGAAVCEVLVVDDGTGMDPDTLRRAFDPFFSGREAGRGIGLGLPKAWRLVEINGGTIAIDSSPGGGSRVSIALPLAAASP